MPVFKTGAINRSATPPGFLVKAIANIRLFPAKGKPLAKFFRQYRGVKTGSPN
jgi:hypothetical protein